MCIAIAKPAGVELPDEKTLHVCWTNNSHGAGFAYADEGNVFIRKGFMTWQSFLDAWNATNEKISLKEKGVLIHFRIATHGAMDSTMTHPFPLHGDDGALGKSEYTCDYAVIHNGIISLTSTGLNKTAGLSDTAVFIKKYLTLISQNRNWFRTDANMELIGTLIDSKMAIISRTGEIKMTSGFTEDAGIFWSNTSYKDNFVKKGYTTYYSGNSYNSGGHYSGKNWGATYGSGYTGNYASNTYSSDRIPQDITEGADKSYKLMRSMPGDMIESDSGSFVASAVDRYFLARPSYDGESAIYFGYLPATGISTDAPEYFMDFEYIGTGIIYDSFAKKRSWREDVTVYADQFLGEITPDAFNVQPPAISQDHTCIEAPISEKKNEENTNNPKDTKTEKTTSGECAVPDIPAEKTIKDEAGGNNPAV